MSENKDYLWVPFYRELAEKILDFQNKRDNLIQIIQDIFTKKTNY